MPVLPLIAILAGPPPLSQPGFACAAGRKRIEVVQHGDRLTYRYGLPGRAEITLGGDPAGGVYYHRTLRSRGEDQTLRFVRGAWSYVVYHRWQAPSGSDARGLHTVPEYFGAGVVVMRNGRLVRRLRCTGDDLTSFYEWPLFRRLMPDPTDPMPTDA